MSNALSKSPPDRSRLSDLKRAIRPISEPPMSSGTKVSSR
jgi:hypothetical protein